MRLLPVAFFVVILLFTSSTDTLAPYDIGIEKESKWKLWFLPFANSFMDCSYSVRSQSLTPMAGLYGKLLDLPNPGYLVYDQRCLNLPYPFTQSIVS